MIKALLLSISLFANAVRFDRVRILFTDLGERPSVRNLHAQAFLSLTGLKETFRQAAEGEDHSAQDFVKNQRAANEPECWRKSRKLDSIDGFCLIRCGIPRHSCLTRPTKQS